MKKIIILSMAFMTLTVTAEDFCPTPTQPAIYLEAKKNAEAQTTAFANSPLIATQADQLLSKLAQAQSPVLLNWMAQRKLSSQDEVRVVKEWRLYFANNFILSKYPHEEARINLAIESLVDGILTALHDPSFITRLEGLFVRAQAEAIKTIESMPVVEKKPIIERIQSLRLHWSKNFKTARNNARPLELIDWGIAYDPVPNEINIGLDALAYPDDETLLAVLAHEMGHSFDSCRWGAFFKGEWPFTKVGTCLRSAKSVAAKPRDDSKMEDMIKRGRLTRDLATGLKANPTCNKLAYPPIGVQADQLPEAFADWFSTEVMTRMKELNVSKIRLDLCQDNPLNPGSSYPTNRERLKKIYRQRPADRCRL